MKRKLQEVKDVKLLVVSTEKACELLNNISEDTLERLWKKGEFRKVRIGSRGICWFLHELEAYLERNAESAS